MVNTIKLPCSIGDEVYIRWSRFDGRIYKENVRSLLFNEGGISINTDNLVGGDWLDDVFPTKESAFESARKSGYEPFLEVETMSVYPEIEEIAHHVNAIDNIIHELDIDRGCDVGSYDWSQAEIVELNPLEINYMREHDGATNNYYICKSEYCRACVYFRTTSPGKYVKVPFVKE